MNGSPFIGTATLPKNGAVILLRRASGAGKSVSNQSCKIATKTRQKIRSNKPCHFIGVRFPICSQNHKLDCAAHTASK